MKLQSGDTINYGDGLTKIQFGDPIIHKQMRQPFTFRQCFGKSPGTRQACVGCEIYIQCVAQDI